MKIKRRLLYPLLLLLLCPCYLFARSEIIICPTLFEVHSSESSGKSYYRWWTEDYNHYWRGSGVKLSRYNDREQNLANARLTIDMNDKGFIHCEYTLKNKTLGQLKLAKSGRYCRFMAESYQTDCQQGKRMCCTKPNSARCHVIMCSS